MAGVDTDKDGIKGQDDKCPSQPRGRFDFNKNGCPGPYAQIRPRFVYSGLTTSQGIVRIEKMEIAGLPRSAAVTFTGRLRGKVTVGSSGKVRIANTDSEPLSLARGATIGLKITRPGFIGYFAVLLVSTERPPTPTRVQCMPAVGRQAPVRCNRVDRGK